MIPIKADGSKSPAVGWKPYQSRLPDQRELNRWFLADNVGVAIVHGQVSGTELIDIDDAKLYEPYCDEVERLAPGLLEKLTVVKTPRPGMHFYYRCSAVSGNKKLAVEADGKTLIETRGQGGYALAPGSPAECHESGRLYEHISGPDLSNLPTITPGERRALFQAATTFDESPVEEPDSVGSESSRSGCSPGDDYNIRASWSEILEPAGWIRTHVNGDKEHWRRPGKTLGWSATAGCKSKSGNELFYCFSSNAQPFESEKSYSKFGAYTLLNHAGGFKAAARQLASEGYGSRQSSSEQPSPTQDKEKTPRCEKFLFSELRQKYPTLNPPIVDGLFRAGETVNIISASKAGKSWLVYDLAISIITGEPWLGEYPTSPGKVLLIDNELHKSVLAHRIPKVCEAKQHFLSDIENDLEIWPLRGNLKSIEDLAFELRGIEPGRYKAIILDAKYRFDIEGASENDNAAETRFYNLIDRIAEHTQASIVMIHHSSKGEQSGKRVTDVGSGAGAQSRAADCHLVLREHEEDGVFVLDGAVRSFPPVKAIALRWDFPLWVRADDVDAADLRGLKTKSVERKDAKNREDMEKIIDALRDSTATARRLREATGLGKDRLGRLLDNLVFQGDIIRAEVEIRGNICHQYQLEKSEI